MIILRTSEVIQKQEIDCHTVIVERLGNFIPPRDWKFSCHPNFVYYCALLSQGFFKHSSGTIYFSITVDIPLCTLRFTNDNDIERLFRER